MVASKGFAAGKSNACFPNNPYSSTVPGSPLPAASRTGGSCLSGGRFFQNFQQVDVGKIFDVCPGPVAAVIASANALIQCFQCLLNAHCLQPLGVVEHNADAKAAYAAQCSRDRIRFFRRLELTRGLFSLSEGAADRNAAGFGGPAPAKSGLSLLWVSKFRTGH